jgi:hypothetical protein
MNNYFVDINRQKAIQRYVSALDEGDLDNVALVLELAAEDPILDQMIIEINQSIEQEEELTDFAKDAEIVRSLVHQHFASELIDNNLERPLTVGEVVARMQADRNVPTLDQSVHQNLLRLAIPLPEFLSIQAIRKLATNLQVNASERFWRSFRDTAIKMGIGRGQAQMAAARKQKLQKSTKTAKPGKSESKR